MNAVPPGDYLLGLDLGKTNDPTALAILEKTRFVDPVDQNWRSRYALRHLQRWTLGTRYTHIVADVADLACRLPERSFRLAVDETGVGAAVCDLLQQTVLATVMSPVLITGGHQLSCDGRRWCVPKKELVSTALALLQSERIKFGRVPDRDVLIKEFDTFSVKITPAGNETFESWRDRDHDDMVLAVALGCWLGELVDKYQLSRGIEGPLMCWPDEETAAERLANRTPGPRDPDQPYRPGDQPMTGREAIADLGIDVNADW